MNAVLKGGCLALYLAALAGLFVELPLGSTTVIQYAAIFFLVAHVGELLLFFKKVKLYPGPLAVSVVLTVLFGVLHWLPLGKTDKQAN
ncbi:MAG: hypothetical protein M0P39_04690 [Rhodocyclaceae bacterium]|nr:hypothetical protein [Rhodocyclaceae bacterium]